MKKILIVNSHIPWGGLGQFTLSLVDGLKEKNYTIYGLITHDNSANFELFENKVDENYYVGNLGKIKKYFSALKYIYKIKPDLIIINYNAVIHFLLPFLPKSKVIDIIHSEDKEFYRISNINSQYIDSWITPTPGVKKHFFEYSNNQKKQTENTKVISHGVRTSQNLNESKSEIFEILFVGVLYEHKGVNLLPEIFKQIKDKHSNVRLNIVGDGILKDDIEKKFEELGLKNDVIFHGVISHEEVRKKMAESHVLLFPTRVEAFGLVIAEAMMEGVVPVVSLLEGITDATVKNNETGFLVKKDDEDTFAEKILYLIENKNSYEKMSIQTKEYAVKNLSLEAMSSAYDKEIKRLLNEK